MNKTIIDAARRSIGMTTPIVPLDLPPSLSDVSCEVSPDEVKIENKENLEEVDAPVIQSRNSKGPFCMAYIYPQTGKAVIVKGWYRDVNEWMKNKQAEVPFIAHKTIFMVRNVHLLENPESNTIEHVQNHSYHIYGCKEIFEASFHKTCNTLDIGAPYVLSNPLGIADRNPTRWHLVITERVNNIVVMDKKLRRVPRCWMKELNEYVEPKQPEIRIRPLGTVEAEAISSWQLQGASLQGASLQGASLRGASATLSRFLNGRRQREQRFPPQPEILTFRRRTALNLLEAFRNGRLYYALHDLRASPALTGLSDAEVTYAHNIVGMRNRVSEENIRTFINLLIDDLDLVGRESWEAIMNMENPSLSSNWIEANIRNAPIYDGTM